MSTTVEGSTERTLQQLAAADQRARDVAEEITRTVAQARAQGASWYAIAAALGITRQSATARFADRVQRYLPS